MKNKSAETSDQVRKIERQKREEKLIFGLNEYFCEQIAISKGEATLAPQVKVIRAIRRIFDETGQCPSSPMVREFLGYNDKDDRK